MSFNIKGVDVLKFKLNKISEDLHNETNKELHETAVIIQQTAKNMAPIQYSPLRKSIKIQRTAVAKKGVRGFVSGLSSYNIYVDFSTSAPTRGGTVASYAYMIHEHMGYGNVIGSIMPSKISIASGNGEIVGGKFMERAILKHQPTLVTKMNRAVKFVFDKNKS